MKMYISYDERMDFALAYEPKESRFGNLEVDLPDEFVTEYLDTFMKWRALQHKMRNYYRAAEDAADG